MRSSYSCSLRWRYWISLSRRSIDPTQRESAQGDPAAGERGGDGMA